MFKNPLEIVMGLIKKNQPSKQKTCAYSCSKYTHDTKF